MLQHIVGAVVYGKITQFILFVAIRAEMMPDEKPDRSEVQKFDASKLKHVETQEKNVMPTNEGNCNKFVLSASHFNCFIRTCSCCF